MDVLYYTEGETYRVRTVQCPAMHLQQSALPTLSCSTFHLPPFPLPPPTHPPPIPTHPFKGFEAALQHRAAQRSLRDITIGPVLTWTTKAMLDHVDALLQIPGARRVFGGRPLVGHQIPDCYGAIEPTAVYVPLREVLCPKNYELVTKEVFGPVQV